MASSMASMRITPKSSGGRGEIFHFKPIWTLGTASPLEAHRYEYLEGAQDPFPEKWHKTKSTQRSHLTESET